jgi:hypothetical protein
LFCQYDIGKVFKQIKKMNTELLNKIEKINNLISKIKDEKIQEFQINMLNTMYDYTTLKEQLTYLETVEFYVFWNIEFNF